MTVARRKPSERVTGRKLPGRRVSTHRRTATGKVGKPAAAAARAGRGKLAKAASTAKKARQAPRRGENGRRKDEIAGQIRSGKVDRAEGNPAARPAPDGLKRSQGNCRINAEENVEWS